MFQRHCKRTFYTGNTILQDFSKLPRSKLVDPTIFEDLKIELKTGGFQRVMGHDEMFTQRHLGKDYHENNPLDGEDGDDTDDDSCCY